MVAITFQSRQLYYGHIVQKIRTVNCFSVGNLSVANMSLLLFFLMLPLRAHLHKLYFAWSFVNEFGILPFGNARD